MKPAQYHSFSPYFFFYFFFVGLLRFSSGYSIKFLSEKLATVLTVIGKSGVDILPSHIHTSAYRESLFVSSSV